MRLLAITDMPPTPHHGIGLRQLHLLRGLHEHYGWRIRVLSLEPQYDLSYPEVDFCEHYEGVPLPAGGSVTKWAWSLKSHLSPTHLRSASHTFLNPHYSPELHRRVVRELKEQPPDVILAGSTYCAYYVLNTNIPRVVDLVDCLPDAYADYIASLSSATPSGVAGRALYRLVRASCIRELRRLRLHGVSAVLATTEAETEALERVAPGLGAIPIGNGVDTAYFAPVALPSEQPTLIFTGSLDAPANAAAILRFCANVLPGLQHKVPGLQLYIVGHSPPPAVQALGERPGILVTGRVADTRPYFDRAWVAIVPVYEARGISNKALEAMAMAKAAVITPAQMRGIDGAEGRHFAVAADDAAFQAQTLALLRDAGLRRRLGEAALELVASHYTWGASVQKLNAELLRAVEGCVRPVQKATA